MERLRPAALVAVLLSTTAIAGCESESEPKSNPSLNLNEQNGTVEGVGLNDPDARIERAFGEAPRHTIYRKSTPIGVHPVDVTLAGEGGCRPRGRENALRYRGVSFISYGGIVCNVTVTSRRAATRRGLRPGDSIQRAEELYPALECGKTNVSSDGTFFKPACWGKVGEGAYMWVGGDPIDAMEFVNRPVGPRQ